MSCITKKLLATQTQSLTKRWGYYKARSGLEKIDLTDPTSIPSAGSAGGGIGAYRGHFVVAWGLNILISQSSAEIIKLYVIDEVNGSLTLKTELDIRTVTGESSTTNIEQIHYAYPNTYVTVITDNDSIITYDISSEGFNLLDRYALGGGQSWSNDALVIRKVIDPYKLSQSLYDEVYNPDYIFIITDNSDDVVWWFNLANPSSITLVEYADVDTSGVGTIGNLAPDDGLAYYNSNTDSGKLILFSNNDDPDFNSFNFSASSGSLSADTGSTTTTGIIGDNEGNFISSNSTALYGTTIISLHENDDVTKGSTATFAQTAVTDHVNETENAGSEGFGTVWAVNIVHRQGYLYALVRDDGVLADEQTRIIVYNIGGSATTAPVLIDDRNLGIYEVASNTLIEVDPRQIYTS
tara:strand:- start:3186 stop:4412 length:1227 start_codon:yes stop_codon:yes gene_type:complete